MKNIFPNWSTLSGRLALASLALAPSFVRAEIPEPDTVLVAVRR